MTDSHWPAIEKLPARIVRGLFRSRNIVWDSDHRIVAASGITWTQFSTLVSLRFAGPDHILTPTELYQATQATSGGMTKMLHALEGAGLIQRIDNPNDQRSRLVQLTPEGATMVEGLVDAFNTTNKALFTSILTQTEAEQLAFLLQKLSKGLDRKRQEEK